MIVGALVMGAAAAANKVGGKALQDAYGGLRQLIADRYKRSAAVAALEQDPSSEQQKKALEKALTKTKAGKDIELLGLAKDLAQALERVSPDALGTVGLRLDDIKAMNARFGDIDVSGGAATITKVDVKRNLRIGNIRVRNPK
jgi:hypothetical protein